MSRLRRISLIGSTGSIGASTCSVVRESRGRIELVGLAARASWERLLEQTLEFRPRKVGLVDEEAARRFRENLPGGIACEVVSGPDSLGEIAAMEEAETAVCAALGAAGIPPVVAAIRAGKQVGLANKESLVAAGGFITGLAREHGVELLPIDSEHSAIFQCLRGERPRDVERLVLTASGGPFRTCSAQQLEAVTLAQALKHPNWSMGDKITIDSASLMNKGLEVIEAHWLFGVPFDRIAVVVHPQSIVHSMVEMRDGCVIAQLGVTDMRTPIQYAITFPERLPTPYLERLSLTKVGALTFEEPDMERFRCLRLAFHCGRSGGTYPAVLNAANEVAVDHFLSERIRFLDIPRVIEGVLEKHDSGRGDELGAILEADGWARSEAGRLAVGLGRPNGRRRSAGAVAVPEAEAGLA